MSAGGIDRCGAWDQMFVFRQDAYIWVLGCRGPASVFASTTYNCGYCLFYCLSLNVGRPSHILRLKSMTVRSIKVNNRRTDVAFLDCCFSKPFLTQQRGSQAGRLAHELRLIASGQASASLALCDAGSQLVADALAEKPLPREYMSCTSHGKRARHVSGGKSCARLQEKDRVSGEESGERSLCGSEGNKARNGTVAAAAAGFIFPADKPEDRLKAAAASDAAGVITGICVAANGETAEAGESIPREKSDASLTSAAVTSAVAASIAIDVAAREEETAAAARIQLFLRRRRREARPLAVGVSLEGGAAVASATSSASLLSSGGHERKSGAVDWFVEAVRFFRREVDIFLLDDEGQDPSGSGDSESSPVSDNDIAEQDLDLESNPATASVSTADDSGESDHETADDSNVEPSSDDDDGDEWPIFPPLPLRARAPSLYTLPPPGSGSWKRGARDGDGNDDGGATDSPPTGGAGRGEGIFTRLDVEVAARLSSARSVFSLRASDVLTAFSPPPPPPPPLSSSLLAESAAAPNGGLMGPRPSTVSGTEDGRGDRHSRRGSCRLSSPDALRQRLRTEAINTSSTGLGRPWLLSSHKKRTLTRHRQEQQRRLVSLRKNNKHARDKHGVGGYGSGRDCGDIERAREKRRRIDFFGPISPLGQRLAKRYNAGLAARRQRIVGQTDAFRARHVGRQLRSGVATNALERVERALDSRLSAMRERRVPPAHVAELLDVLDRHVYSGSQVRHS